MNETFTPEQEGVIQQKIELFRGVMDGLYTLETLGDIIAEKRLKWVREDDEWLEDIRRYGVIAIPGLIDMHFAGYMRIEPNEYERFLFLDEDHCVLWGEIHSKGFCPYLEACKRLGMDTRVVCKRALERPVQAVLGEIYKGRVRFWRAGYRPYEGFCDERFAVRLTADEYWEVLRVIDPELYEAYMECS